MVFKNPDLAIFTECLGVNFFLYIYLIRSFVVASVLFKQSTVNRQP